MKTRLFFLLPLISVLLTSEAQILNGNFQTPGLSNCDAGANWIVSTGTDAPQYVVDGSNSWIDITPCGGFGNGSYIEQTINTTAGQSYYLEFDLATTYGWQIWDSGLDIYINGAPLNVGANRVFHNSFNTSFPGANQWKTLQSSSFVASSSSTTIRLEGNGANPQNPSYQQPGVGPGVMGLDNVILKQGSLTSISNIQRKNFNITLAPQPASSSFKIISSDLIQSYEIIDLTGKSISVANYTGAEIGTSSLSNGVYFLRLNSLTGSQTTKLVVQH